MDWILENYEWIILLVIGVIELVIRYVPTANDISVLSKIYNLLNWLVPNKRITENNPIPKKYRADRH